MSLERSTAAADADDFAAAAFEAFRCSATTAAPPTHFLSLAAAALVALLLDIWPKRHLSLNQYYCYCY